MAVQIQAGKDGTRRIYRITYLIQKTIRFSDESENRTLPKTHTKNFFKVTPAVAGSQKTKLYNFILFLILALIPPSTVLQS